MKLGEFRTDIYSSNYVEPFPILKVPGGWIFYKGNCGEGTFVPYNNEFEVLEIEPTPKPSDGSPRGY